MRNLALHLVLALLALALLSGCEPATTHRFLTTFFDEVPVLPPVEEYCQEVLDKKAQPESAQAEAAPVYQSSIHAPYGEKRCNGCHEAEKTTISGLLKPETELCFMCHPGILKHRYAHGPAAEGECLGCHLPHDGAYPSLLARDPVKLCQKCHSEQRSAAGMHDKIQAKGVRCIDCHDPHSGDSRYFLK